MSFSKDFKSAIISIVVSCVSGIDETETLTVLGKFSPKTTLVNNNKKKKFWHRF